VSSLYRTWLEFTVWFVCIVFWLFIVQGLSEWWQPVTLWFTFLLIYFITKKLGHEAHAIPFVAILVLVSWVFLYRLNPNWATSQFWGTLVSVIAYFAGLSGRFTCFDSPWFWSSSSLTLLVLTLLFGVRIGGAKAWLAVGTFRFQPIELARVLLFIFLGRELVEKRQPKGMYAILIAFFLVLALQKDLGPALLVFLSFCSLSLYVSFSWAKLGIYVGIAFSGFFSSLLFFPHMLNRIEAWLRPWKFLDSKGYQILQGLFALRAGGLIGSGLGAGMVQVIPEAHTDYLFAVIGEEFGLLGTWALILIYATLAFWGIKLLRGVDDDAQRTIGLGFVFLFHIQIFMVIGGILRFLPFTGMTLPFLSFGSTSLVAQFWMLGMLTSMGRKSS